MSTDNTTKNDPIDPIIPLDCDPVPSLRPAEGRVTLSANEYRHLNGDTDMYTRDNRSTLVEVRMELTPHPNWQKPTSFAVEITSRHRESEGDRTEFKATNVIKHIPVSLADNEYFLEFEGNVREYVYSRRLGGTIHGWKTIVPGTIVDSIKVRFDGRGDDRNRQGLDAYLRFNYRLVFCTDGNDSSLPEQDVEYASARLGLAIEGDDGGETPSKG